MAPWLVAPIGASAVLVFGVPSSPLAQPWAVVAGNTLSALIGTVIALLMPDSVAMAAALAVALAIAVMLWARCLHPPGGAAALLVVLAHKPSFDIVLFPFLLNSVLLVVAGLVYNNLTARPYPHHSKTDRDDTHANNRFKIASPTPTWTGQDSSISGALSTSRTPPRPTTPQANG